MLFHYQNFQVIRKKGGPLFLDVTNGHNNTSVTKRVRKRVSGKQKFPFEFYFSVLSNASSNRWTLSTSRAP